MARRIFIIFIALMGLALHSAAATQPRPPHPQTLIDSLENRLATIRTAEDSISSLYAIFDLAHNKATKGKALKRLYHTAAAQGNENVQFDVLTHGINLYFHEDSILKVIEADLRKLPESDRRTETELFLRLRRMEHQQLLDNAEETDRHLGQLIKSYNTDMPDDPYEQAEMLFALCIHLGKTTRGELLEEYVDKLIALVESLNLQSGAVRNLVYTKAAPMFTNNRRHKKAVEIDKKMLNIIDSLVNVYSTTGRPYRKMHTYRYVCMRRMLGNYPALSPLEVEHLYKQVKELASLNTQVDYDMRSNERAEIFYLLAKEEWAKVLPMLKRQIDTPSNKDYRTYFLKAIVEAADHTGDRNAQLKAAMELCKRLDEKLERRSYERYREFQILYDLNELRQEKDALIIARHKEIAEHSLIIIVVGSILTLALIVVVVILWQQKRKLKKLSERRRTAAKNFRRELDAAHHKNALLTKARDQAIANETQKNDLIATCSHEMKAPLDAIAEYSRLIVDCIPAEQSHYLDRFASVIEENTKIVNSIVDDVMDINAIDSGAMRYRCEPTSIYKTCDLAIMTLFDNGRPNKEDLTLEFNPGHKPDAIVDIDGARVSQILMNLLKNAERFTEHGTITLDFEVSKDTVQFSVADTGIGIPEKQAEKIFERFHKVDSHSPGAGLGLYVSRLISNMMGATLTVDTHYHGGARFVLSIPLKRNRNK